MMEYHRCLAKLREIAEVAIKRSTRFGGEAMKKNSVHGTCQDLSVAEMMFAQFPERA
jgi:hypothetical protein